MRGRPTATERFWAKFTRQPSGCWQWTAATDKATGYGKFHLAPGAITSAHRFAYETFVAPVPQGLDLDHLCRNRACVNPAHLEPVTRQVNLLRGDTLAAAHAAGRYCGAPRCRTCKQLRPDETAA